jgi:hypothetical protein
MDFGIHGYRYPIITPYIYQRITVLTEISTRKKPFGLTNVYVVRQLKR